jgi:hypothetical protein
LWGATFIASFYIEIRQVLVCFGACDGAD